MKQTCGSNGVLYTTAEIGDHTNKTIDINETGVYYLKTKAECPDEDPVYKKGKGFRVHVSSNGYSAVTIKFSLQKNISPPDPRDLFNAFFRGLFSFKKTSEHEMLSGDKMSESDFNKDTD